ncbi:sorting nexin-9 [Cimex lectularius]|uniref:Sorting nexin n=1 Tax=Cimex lectularius TaxID=79782 RepID=A0A8I6S1R9_CIMLE|nr:sorting nexin-9 [Cimex lectularius]
MNVKVQALYDFQGEPKSSELTITAGEILTVTRQDVGEGWWEGTNQNGETGLFPAAYVENYEATEFWEDEWEDDWGDTAPTDPSPPETELPQPRALHNEPSVKGNDETTAQVFARRNFNRHSTFLKSIGENYLLSVANRPVPDTEKLKIIDGGENGYLWAPITEPYYCLVASPKKESKLKGLKSFIVYQITPSFNNIQVSRRYKHFDWLHERLEEKYSFVPIPPLPEKQISGRYEEQFIEHRKNQLQAFVDCVCRHPVLSRSPVWQHFITCTDDKMWKVGKRKAEKDEFVGACEFYAIDAPETSINQFTLEQETLSCSKFVHNMEGAVKHLIDTTIDQTKKHQGPYKREYQKIGQAFYTLSQAMSSDLPKAVGHEHLTTAIKAIGDSYSDIGRMFEEQPKLDWAPLGDMLHIYKGLLTSLPYILNLHKKALQTKKDCEKMTFDQKMNTSQLDVVTRHTDIVSYSLLAEINHFYMDQADEVSKSLKNYLTQQVTFYKKITEKLESALSMLDA